MNKKAFICITACLFIVSNTSKAMAAFCNSTTDFSAECRKFQQAPTGHTPGKDNGPGFGFHNAGEDCGICHKPAGRAPNQVFTMSGTLYEDRAARKPLKGGEVVLQDFNGKVISMTSNEAGNFWTYEPIGSNPYTVVGKGVGMRLYTTDASGFHPADPKYPQTWQYKTWVKNGNHVIPMVTIAPVGGATVTNGIPDMTSRMSCSMHHSPMGSRGGLWASTKSTLKSYPSSGLSFKKHIMPIFKSKCVPCHIPGSTMTRIVTMSDYTSYKGPKTKVDYSNNLDLTSYAGSTVTTTDGTNGAKRGAKDVINKLLSTTLIENNNGTLTHAGGGFWTRDDTDYKAIEKWIAEGAQNNQ